MDKLIVRFRKFVDKHGFVEAAHRLKYRDTGAIKNWLLRKKIPKKQLTNVETMLKGKI